MCQMEDLEETAAVPAFVMLDLIENDTSVEYIYLQNGVRFYVSIDEEDLQGDGGLLADFNDFRDDLQDPENMYLFEDWILQAMEEFMSEVAPTPEPGTRTPVTLLQYFSPPTFFFKLVNKDGKLTAVQGELDTEKHADTSPRTLIVDTLPNEHSLSDDDSLSTNVDIILRSTLPHVPSFLASELERVDDGVDDVALGDLPTNVRRVGADELLFFKGGFKLHGHKREMNILGQISRSDRFIPPLQTSQLLGLVFWDDLKKSLMGFLLECIEGDTLQTRMEEAPLAMRMKWIDQVDATVRLLHDLDIVWGDVKPDNVMINQAGDAVVVDFGGGYTPAYIPLELQQTKEGDLLGLDHVRAAISKE